MVSILPEVRKLLASCKLQKTMVQVSGISVSGRMLQRRTRLRFWGGLLLAWGTLLLAAPSAFAASPGWEEGPSHEDGAGTYQLWEKKEPGSPFLRFRVEGVIQSSMEQASAAVTAIQTDDRLLEDGQKRTILSESDQELKVLIQTQVPIVSGQEAVVRMVRGYDENGDFRVSWQAVREPGEVASKGFVRMKGVEGYWRVSSVGPTKVLVVYELFSIPGGSAPSWLVNRMARSRVLQDYEKMRALARGEVLNGVKLSLAEDKPSRESGE